MSNVGLYLGVFGAVMLGIGVIACIINWLVTKSETNRKLIDMCRYTKCEVRVTDVLNDRVIYSIKGELKVESINEDVVIIKEKEGNKVIEHKVDVTDYDGIGVNKYGINDGI